MTRTELIIVLEMPLALHFIAGLFVTKNSKINYHSFGANIDFNFSMLTNLNQCLAISTIVPSRVI